MSFPKEQIKSNKTACHAKGKLNINFYNLLQYLFPFFPFQSMQEMQEKLSMSQELDMVHQDNL